MRDNSELMRLINEGLNIDLMNYDIRDNEKYESIINNIKKNNIRISDMTIQSDRGGFSYKVPTITRGVSNSSLYINNPKYYLKNRYYVKITIRLAEAVESDKYILDMSDLVQYKDIDKADKLHKNTLNKLLSSYNVIDTSIIKILYNILICNDYKQSDKNIFKISNKDFDITISPFASVETLLKDDYLEE